MVEGGKTPFLPARELEAIGYNLVIYPVSATYAAAKAVTGLMEELKRTGTTSGFGDRMWQFSEFSEFIGLEEFRRQERRYLDEGLASASALPKGRKRRDR
jgi:methylisocitrate lyase